MRAAGSSCSPRPGATILPYGPAVLLPGPLPSRPGVPTAAGHGGRQGESGGTASPGVKAGSAPRPPAAAQAASRWFYLKKKSSPPLRIFFLLL